MKTFLKKIAFTTFLKKIAFTFCIFSMFALQSRAQWDAEKMHLQIDWQMNAPYSTDFADKISGWGMNFEAVYDVAPRWAIGAFINFHTNHKYVGRQTLPFIHRIAYNRPATFCLSATFRYHHFV